MSSDLEHSQRRRDADPEDWSAVCDHARALARSDRLEEAYLLLYDHGGLERADPLTRELAAQVVARQGEVLEALSPMEDFVCAADRWPVTPRYGPPLWRLQVPRNFRGSRLPVQKIERVAQASGRRLALDLAKFRCLRELSLRHPYGDPWDLLSLSLPPSLVSLDLSGCKRLPENRLLALRGLRVLAVLNLRGLPIEDRDLAALEGLPALDTLELGRTEVSDRGLNLLADLPKLRRLYALGCPIQGHSLARFRTLRHLDLSETRVDDRGAAAIASLTELETLALSETAISSESVRLLGDLRKLRSLSVTETSIDDSVLESLLKLERLEEVNVSGTQISAAGLIRLAKKSPARSITADGRHLNTVEAAGFRERFNWTFSSADFTELEAELEP